MTGLVTKGKHERKAKIRKMETKLWKERMERSNLRFEHYVCCGEETVGIYKGGMMVCPKCLKPIK